MICFWHLLDYTVNYSPADILIRNIKIEIFLLEYDSEVSILSVEPISTLLVQMEVIKLHKITAPISKQNAYSQFWPRTYLKMFIC